MMIMTRLEREARNVGDVSLRLVGAGRRCRCALPGLLLAGHSRDDGTSSLRTNVQIAGQRRAHANEAQGNGRADHSGQGAQADELDHRL